MGTGEAGQQRKISLSQTNLQRPPRQPCCTCRCSSLSEDHPGHCTLDCSPESSFNLPDEGSSRMRMDGFERISKPAHGKGHQYIFLVLQQLASGLAVKVLCCGVH